MELIFNEQDLVDSICVYTAEQEYTNPENIQVDLVFHPTAGFSATASAPAGTRKLNEQDVIDAITVYLRDYHNFNPDLLFVDLQFKQKEQITASIQVRSV